jgi:hypothetical protein
MANVRFYCAVNYCCVIKYLVYVKCAFFYSILKYKEFLHMLVHFISRAGSDSCAMVYTSQIFLYLSPRVHSTEATLLLCSLFSSQITFSGYIDAYIDYCYWIGHVYALHNLVLICIQVLACTSLSLSLSLSLILSPHYHLFKHPFHLVAALQWVGCYFTHIDNKPSNQTAFPQCSSVKDAMTLKENDFSTACNSLPL